jgi:hypothetical protein
LLCNCLKFDFNSKFSNLYIVDHKKQNYNFFYGELILNFFVKLFIFFFFKLVLKVFSAYFGFLFTLTTNYSHYILFYLNNYVLYKSDFLINFIIFVTFRKRISYILKYRKKFFLNFYKRLFFFFKLFRIKFIKDNNLKLKFAFKRLFKKFKRLFRKCKRIILV